MYKIRVYKKDLEYTYALGIFPTLEALHHKQEEIDQVMISANPAQVHDEHIAEIKQLCDRLRIPYTINDRKLMLIGPKENTYAAAVIHKYSPEISAANSHVVLASPKNMGNLGTIIRTMIAFGLRDLAIIRPAADVFDPKVISSTMGAMFQIDFQYFDSLKEYASKHSNRKLYTFTSHNAQDIRETKFEKPFSLVFGNEGQGLTTEEENLGTPIQIPQPGNFESLNLSIAVGIGIWESTK